MEHGKKQRPKRLGAKLRAIRDSLGITQDEMAKRLKALGAEEALQKIVERDPEDGDLKRHTIVVVMRF